MQRAAGRLFGLLGTLGLAAMGCLPSKTPAPALPTANSPKADASTIELFIATRLWNTTEPCGCTSTPLGDVARIAALLKSSPDRSLLLDAGGLRYEPKVLSASKLPQARLKADFIEKTWQELSAVVMVQSEDLRGEQGLAELVATKRLVANLAGLPEGVATPRQVLTLLGVKLGIVGITDPTGPWPAGILASDPETALGEQLAALRGEGVESVIVLSGMTREKTRRLARKFPDVKLWVAGANDKVEEGVELPEILGGGALLVTPGFKGERLFHISIHPSATGSLVWRFVATPKQRQRQISVLRERVSAADKLLAGLQQDTAADPAFIKTQQAELQNLREQISQLSQAPSHPDGDGYVTAELQAITRSLSRDPTIRKKLDELDQQIGQANLKALDGPPPDTLPGSPRYVGNTNCLGACHFHEAAHKLWQTTQHSRAHRTLVEVGKELSYDCVGCHSTAFDTPAGSNLFTINKWQQATTPPVGMGPDMRHVGCEVCHGPGSLHVAAPGKVKIPTQRPDENTCLGCHTKEHSDTFEWKAYARGILGEGHGAATRQTLGEGPTGRELRQAARQKAAEH